MTHSLDLLFLEPSTNDFPGPRIAQIYLKTHSSDKKGNILITPQCVSMGDFDGEIERLMRELEVIREKGKRKFSKQAKGKL